MITGIRHTHYLVVTIFLMIYVVKTILLLSDKKELLAAFSKKTRIVEMIVSVLFLITGIYLATTIPYGGKYIKLFYIKLAMVFASIPIAIIGFKKSNKLLAALSLLLITGSFALAEVYHQRKGISNDDSTSATSDGKSLYEAKCVLCHGDDGKLGMSGAKDLSATELDVPSIANVILHGQKSMVPVQGVSEEQATAIAQYVDTQLKGH